MKILTKGPIACTRIRIGKGVCGTSWSNKKTIIVDDVEKFPGHIGLYKKIKQLSF
jgi:L-methionine (R)-S-oxide reductase